MRRQTIVNEISEAMRKFPESETYLYGSEARGDAKPDSDIDLLILLPDSLTVKERIATELAIHGELWPIELNTDTQISPVILQKKVWNQRVTPFTINVTNDRVRIGN